MYAGEDGQASSLGLLELADDVADALAEFGVASESVLEVAKIDGCHGPSDCVAER